MGVTDAEVKPVRDAAGRAHNQEPLLLLLESGGQVITGNTLTLSSSPTKHTCVTC